jgi:hypothetical protein
MDLISLTQFYELAEQKAITIKKIQVDTGHKKSDVRV